MKNLVSEGTTLTLTAPSGGVVSGTGYLIGAIFGVAVVTATEGESFAFLTEGVVSLPKTSAQAWTEGARIYWDDGNDEATTTAAGNTFIGVAAAAASNPSSSGNVRLNGTSPDVSGSITQADAVADLTEDGGAIGGTNDGDIPDLSGTATGTDAAIITALQASVREQAAKINALLAELRQAGVIASS